MELLKVKNLTFAYPKNTEKAVDDFSFIVEEGDFIVFTGVSGCGKTTLLRLLKKELAPKGTLSGQIQYLAEGEIGFVLQNPESQIVTDKVYHELAFGLENLGVENEVIRRRIAEVSCFFGIHSWFHQNTDQLSGGQKQILNLAAIMVMQPKLLILDEPTSRLDPIAAEEFIGMLHKLNEEFGLTILLSEHRLEEVFPYANRCIVMEHGHKLVEGKPLEIGNLLRKKDESHPMLKALPAAMRICAALETEETAVTVREGKQVLREYCRKFGVLESSGDLSNAVGNRKTLEVGKKDDYVLAAKEIWFRYHRDTEDILCGADLALKQREILSILGGNGAGKSTLLGCIAGIRPIYRGKIKKNGHCVMLPQDPQSVFVKMSVQEDYREIPGATEEKIHETAELLGITELLSRHPYDLSGGEQQKAALGKILLCEPEILLLDEPTKGMDADFKQQLWDIFRKLKARMSILMVTHDVEFAAEVSDRCAMFFDGEVIAMGSPQKFFGGNHFYTTAANRIAGEMYPEAVTVSDVVKRVKELLV